MNTRMCRWLAVCLLMVMPAISACGRKTTPLTPDSPRPEAIKDIKIVTRDNVAYLSWPLPAKNVEGKSFNPSDVARILVYRAEFGRDRRKARYKLHAEIDMANPAPAAVRNNTVSWTDANLKYGQSYGYQIRTISARGGISPWSAEARTTPLISLAVPAGLTAVGKDGYNRLSWEPVTTWLDNSPAEGYIGYNIYRGAGKGIHDELPLNKEPLQAVSYKDTSVANDQTYYYVVRSVDSPEPTRLESPDSAEASATPRDLTPPARPTGLTVVPGVDRVFLTWNENKERDLAGYLLYRSTRSGRDYVRLTDKPLARTLFSDEAVKSGTTYYYVITAVDRSGNESARSEEKNAFVEKLR